MSILMNTIRDFLFPFLSLYKSTRITNNKIDSLLNSKPDRPYSYEYASTNENLEDRILIETLRETIENKKILEDKAKSSLIAITISQHLFLILLNLYRFSQFYSSLVALAFISFFSLTYMVMAGILSLYSIGEINKVSTMLPEDYLLEKKERNIQIADNIEYNYLNNLKRNNLMSTSYKCMITSISLLLLIFLISTAISLQAHTKKEELQTMNNEINKIGSQISNVSKHNSDNRQVIVDIQRNIMKSINYSRNLEENLRATNLLIKDMNKKLDQNADGIKKLLMELEKEVKALN